MIAALRLLLTNDSFVSKVLLHIYNGGEDVYWTGLLKTCWAIRLLSCCQLSTAHTFDCGAQCISIVSRQRYSCLWIFYLPGTESQAFVVHFTVSRSSLGLAFLRKVNVVEICGVCGSRASHMLARH